MPSTPNEFFQSIDCTIEDEGNTLSFSGNGPLVEQKSKNTVTPISHRDLLIVEGTEASKFLQGQLTCNLSDLSLEHSILGGACNPKGRLYSSFRLTQLSDTKLVMSMDKGILTDTKKTLAKYIVFSKAELLDAQTDYISIGINGPDAKSLLGKVFSTLPTNIHDVTVCNNSTTEHSCRIIKVSEKDRFEILCPIASAEPIWKELTQHFEKADSELWKLLLIEDGMGEVSAATADMFIPQMLNFNTTGAISFSKGCYTGQEIVARMEYRGKLKRHMYRLQIAGSPKNDKPMPNPGDELFARKQSDEESDQVNASKNQQSIGNIVSCARVEENRLEALAVLTDIAAESEALSLRPISYENNANAEDQTEIISLLPLPYAITNNKA